MVTILAATKIRVPRLRESLVSRLDLEKRLEIGLTCPLTLISAPAGYGKTTLLAQLATRFPITWLSLDNEDNDPIRFWSNFISALQTRNQRIGTSAFQMLSASQPPTLRAIIVQLINEISAEETLPYAYILVLDDYHLIQSREIHQDLAFLLEHLPEQLRLVIATRIDPPLPLARMRASGKISEFRAQDLRFTLSETENLLNSIIGLSLSKDNLTALDVRTEGWVAGLQMAAISMQRQTDLPGFIAAFTGSHRHILDYLTEEVLNQQTEETRQFLLETSILQHLNAQLCDAVTGRQNGFAMLEQLETANLFLVPIDEERKWYRYHNLFASFLFGRFRRLKPDFINELYRRAATWFWQNGFTDEAVSYALTAGDFDLVAEIIGSVAPVYIVRLEYRTILNWLGKLPVETILKHFRLAIFYGFIYAKLGQIEVAETWLKRIEYAPLVIPTSSMSNIALAHIAIAKQNDLKATELLKMVIEDEGAGLPVGSPMVLRNLALKLFASFLLSQIQKAQGHLHLASQTCLSALRTGGYILPENPFSVLLGWLQILLAELLYEQNKLDDAMQHASAGVDIAVQKLEKNLQGYGLTVVEMVRRAQTNNLLEKRVQSSSVTIDGSDIMYVASYSAYPTMTLPLHLRMRFAESDLSAVAKCVKQYQGASHLDEWAIAWPHNSVGVAMVYLSLAEGKVDEARLRLEELQQEAEKTGRTGNLIEILLLLALTKQSAGDNSQAIELIQRVLSMAEPEGYFRIVVDMGVNMAGLLKEAAGQKQILDFIHRLLVECEKKNPRSPMPAGLLREPLTVREMEILKLLANDLSNQEIAQKLVLSTGTIKTHAHHIYAKLGVSTRAQAVKRAINLDLL
jgi:LuxR family transcriptional regulator, maltose regulon positive regulatory protein